MINRDLESIDIEANDDTMYKNIYTQIDAVPSTAEWN